MATTMCDVGGVRPAVVTVRRMVPGQSPRIENLCEVHAAEARGGRSSFGRSPLGGGSLFDEFFGGFFDEEPSVPRARGRVPSPARQAEQIDITRFFSDSMQELVQRAARKAVEWGSLDLTGEHLLWAALQDGVVRRVLEGTGADADEIGAQLEDEAEKGGRKEVSPSLAPDAKRALLAAYEESRALGASYLGPEHVLLALASDEESEAAPGALRRRAHRAARGGRARGGHGEQRDPRAAKPHPDARRVQP